MAHLSDPESVLRKIQGIHEKIEELYETVNLIVDLKDRFDTLALAARADETRMRQSLDECHHLEAMFRESLAAFEESGKVTEAKIDRMISQFKQEKDRIDRVLSTLESERQDIQKLRKTLDDEMARFYREVNARAEEFQARLETRTSEFQKKIEDAIDQGETLITTRMDALNASMQTFREQTESGLSRKAREITQKQEQFQKEIFQDLEDRFSSQARQLHQQVDDHIHTMKNAQEANTRKVNEMLDQMDTEKERSIQLRHYLEKEMEQIHGNFQQLTDETNSRFNQLAETSEHRISLAIDDGNTIIDEQVRHLAEFIETANVQMHQMQSDMDIFKDGMGNHISDQINAMFNSQTEFQQALKGQISAHVVEQIKKIEDHTQSRFLEVETQLDQERVRIAETLQSLVTRKNELDGMRQFIDDALAQAGKQISNKTAFFSTQLRKLILGSQAKVSRVAEEAGKQIEDKVRLLNEAIEKAGAEFSQMHSDISQFQQEIFSQLDARTQDLIQNQTRYQERTSQTMQSQLTEYYEKIRQEMTTFLTEKMESYINRQKVIVDNLIQQIDSFDRRVSIVQTEQRDVIHDQDHKISGLKEFLEHQATRQNRELKVLPDMASRMESLEKQLADLTQNVIQIQNRHLKKQLPSLETRIQSIETKLKEMNQKKGLFSSFSRSRNDTRDSEKKIAYDDKANAKSGKTTSSAGSAGSAG